MKMIQVALCTALLSFASLSATAAEGEPEWLFVQTAAEFTIDGDALTIPYERQVFGFTDRPNRMHAYVTAHEFESLWTKGEDNFGSNPPNAVLTWVEDGEVREAEIVLTSARVGDLGRSITYQIKSEAGHELPHKAEKVSLFVDDLHDTYCFFYGHNC